MSFLPVLRTLNWRAFETGEHTWLNGQIIAHCAGPVAVHSNRSTGLPASANGPRSVQIEINKDESSKIEAFMQSCGYVIDSRHYTMNGEKLAKQGLSNDEIAHNAIFRRTG